MKLVASMIVKDELGRYLEPCVGHLLEFCDEVRILDDGSTDAAFTRWSEWGNPRVHVHHRSRSTFFEHEGRARNELLGWTLRADPTHVLAIDADEFVSDGPALRAAIERAPTAAALTLRMEEVWKLAGDCLCVREDGGWRPHPVPVLWAVPDARTLRRGQSDWRISDRALACGREPMMVGRLARRAGSDSGVDLLHFGWACAADRPARHERYAVADGGRFHANAHLQSILWPDERVVMEGRPWPEQLEPWRAAITARAMQGSG